jgi:glycosyltransferase involved in cell wall biosynthesis
MKRTVSVVQVIDRLGVGGAERVMVNLSNLLHREGMQVTALALLNAGPLATLLDKTIEVVSLNRPYRFHLLTFIRAHKIFRKADIVHVHLKYNFVYASLVKFIFLGRYKIILQDHDNIANATIPFGLIYFLKRNGTFIGVTQSMINWACSNLSVAKKNCWLLPNIVVREEFLREFEEKKVRIVLVSNIKPEKNLMFAIELFAQLEDKLKDAEYHVVGQLADTDYYNELQNHLNTRGLTKKVKWITDCADVQKLVYRYTLGLHTSQHESGPLVLLEYLAQQVPFVAYETGEVAKQLKKHFPNFFLDSLSYTEWVDRICSIIKSSDNYRNSMLAVFDELYSEKKYINDCLSIYASVLSKSLTITS